MDWIRKDTFTLAMAGAILFAGGAFAGGALQRFSDIEAIEAYKQSLDDERAEDLAIVEGIARDYQLFQAFQHAICRHTFAGPGMVLLQDDLAKAGQWHLKLCETTAVRS